MKIVVTGATGHIGTRLSFLALKRGHDVIIASRNRPSYESSWLSFDLSSDNSVVLPRGTDAVVHLAANTTHSNCGLMKTHSEYNDQPYFL